MTAAVIQVNSALSARQSAKDTRTDLRIREDLPAYLESVRHGLVLIDRTGKVVLCTGQTHRILAFTQPVTAEAFTLRQLVRRIRIGTPRTWRDLFAQLRDAVRRDAATTCELVLPTRAVEICLFPVPGQRWAVTVEDISARRASEASAAEMARLDPLTGLPNRLLLRERLNEALMRAQRTGETSAVLLLDLDRFKPINDTLGHPVGDALLQRVADRMRASVRATDTVARIGGDEFVVLQTAVAQPEETRMLARRLVDLIGRSYMVEGQLLTVGASVGIAFAPADGLDADKLLKNADLALYRAKLDGRGTYCFFKPEMDAQMQARRRLELDMRQALARREFELYYQPQLNLESNRVVGCEALVRWNHPERGMVPPLDFIPLAEEIGLIVPIGEWVMRQACRDAVGWPEPLTIAVNLSPAQFKSQRLVEMILSALASSGLSAKRLELEITEGVLLQENEATLRTLHRLRELGIRVSMDDFGTGYSSLSYLRAFPFDKIKIDRSFVQDLASKPDGDAIIRAIAGLGKSLGMTTVAEGVETPEQMRRIRHEGCTDIQGYLISKPIPAEALLALLMDRNPPI